jgi:two-component sensor histidine kinase
MTTSIGMPSGTAPLAPFAEARLLLREFTHRINNDFAAAVSVISLAAARSGSDEVKAVLSVVQDRLQSFASVHRALQMPEHGTQIDAASYLRQLCQAISRSKLESRGIRLVLATRPVRMDSEACWRLGMIVSELITNAARHAFGEGGGEIRVELGLSGSFVECVVADDGAAASPICPARGLKIVNALIEGLDGRIEQRSGETGTMWVVSVPIAHRLEAAPRSADTANVATSAAVPVPRSNRKPVGNVRQFPLPRRSGAGVNAAARRDDRAVQGRNARENATAG